MQDKQKGLEDYKLIMAYRRNKNLRDILVKAKFTSKKPKADFNKYFYKRQFIFNDTTGKGKAIIGIVELKTSNIVYRIQCMVCKRIYIGETKKYTGNPVETAFILY